MIRSLIGGVEDEDEADSQGDDLGGSNSTVESSLQVLFKKYQKACAVCTKIELFAGLINVLETISARVPEFRPNVSKLCEKFLTETGEDEEMTPEGNYNEDYIKFILEHYVQFSPNPAVSLKKLLVDNLYPFVTSEKDPAILLLKKPLVPMFYCTAVKLLNFVHSVNEKSIASTNEEKVRAENNAIELFSAFLGLTKDESFPISNKILLEILRSSNTFLLSLQKKMKMFSDCFTSHRPIIVSSFKSLQIGTRQLHVHKHTHAINLLIEFS